MTHQYADRVAESTTTTGTGAITLAGALTGFVAFSTICSVADTVYYSVWCVDGSGNANGVWETGFGTYSGTNTLTRTTPIKGSATTPVTLAGTSYVTLSSIASQTPQFGPDNGITMPSAGTTALTKPPTSTIQIAGKQIATRGMLTAYGPKNTEYFAQPFMGRQHVGIWTAPGGATTVPGVNGITAITASGTATARVVTPGSLAGMMRRVGYPSAATAGSLGGGRIPTATVTCGSGTLNDGSGFLMIERWVESTPAVVSGQLAFCGMSSNTGAPVATTNPNTLTNTVGIIQIPTDATQWYWYAGGSSAAFVQTAIGIGIGAPGGNSTTAWELAIYCPTDTANTYYMQLTNMTTGTIASTNITGTSAQVPQSATILAWRHFCSNNATALACGIDISSIYLETDY